jgi:hypothetical protein
MLADDGNLKLKVDNQEKARFDLTRSINPFSFSLL